MKLEIIKLEIHNIPDFNILDISGSSSIYKSIMQEHMKCEENVIKQVIEQYTGKPFETKNAKRVTRAFRQGISDKYILAYDNVSLGMVYLYYCEDLNLSVRFEPR